MPQFEDATAADVRELQQIAHELEARRPRAKLGYAFTRLYNETVRAFAEGCSECDTSSTTCGYGSCGYDAAADLAKAAMLLATEASREEASSAGKVL